MSFLKGRNNLDSIKWNYPHQDLFYLPQWQTESTIDIFYLMYRVLYTSFYVTIFLTVISLEANTPISLKIYASCYYTCWNFFLCKIYSVVSLISVFNEYIKQRREKVRHDDVVDKEPSVLYKIQWILLSIVTDSSVALSVGYFSMIHSTTSPYSAQTSIMHLWVPILVIMDFMICSIPAKLLHGYASLCVAIAYTLFTYVYYLRGGLSVYGEHYLYKILDYKQTPGLAILALLTCFSCIVLSRIVVYLLFLFRHKLYWKYFVMTTNPFEVTRYVYEVNGNNNRFNS